jgi:hypothetical protein
MLKRQGKTLWPSILAVTTLFISCGFSPNTKNTSSISTVNIQQSSVKKQSIGNCWLYAVLGWIESLNLRAGWQDINFSESYLTYRHFQEQLLSGNAEEELNTGGSFELGVSLIARYGVMREGDFIPEENSEPRSKRQEDALEILNQSLKDGELSKLRYGNLSQAEARKLVTLELDRAFSVNMASLRTKIIAPEEINLGNNRYGSPLSLSDLVESPEHRWNVIYFPSNGIPQSTPNAISERSASQKNILYRVKNALNDGHPVLVSWFVDFNALKGDSFDLNTLLEANKPGLQGAHITVIEDYVASGIDPVTGRFFRTSEDEVSREEKGLALEYGNIDYFITKNSWGERSDSSYYRDGSYGYHKLMANYAFGWIPEANKNGTNSSYSSFGVSEFILPPGY